jgi:hypothetical protein
VDKGGEAGAGKNELSGENEIEEEHFLVSGLLGSAKPRC